MTTDVMTGSDAAATAVEFARVQGTAAYPMTPHSLVVELLSKWVVLDELPAEFVAVGSEHSAPTVCIGASTVGGRFRGISDEMVAERRARYSARHAGA